MARRFALAERARERQDIVRLLDRLLEWLQGRCQHPSRSVTADVLEGARPGHQVMWCHKCGAYCFSDGREHSTWHRPHPMWEKP
mgnify:CR=1 FL=1